MRRITLFSVCLFFVLSVSISAQKIDSIFDDSVDKSKLEVKQVAIIPNRLPLILQEPERWRLSNWSLLAKKFKRNGFEVLGYYETRDAAKKSNLPLEDTLNAEAKYAEFCRLTDTDLVVMPYYGTSFSSSNFLLFATQHNYTSTVSYQYYTPRENIFFHRADASKTTSYTSGLWSLAGIGVSILGSMIAPDSSAMVILGTGLMAVGTVVDTVKGLKPAEEWWRQSFQTAVPAAADPMISYLGEPAEGVTEKSSASTTSVATETPEDTPQQDEAKTTESPADEATSVESEAEKEETAETTYQQKDSDAQDSTSDRTSQSQMESPAEESTGSTSSTTSVGVNPSFSDAQETDEDQERVGGAIEVSYGWNSFLESAGWDNYTDGGGVYMNNFMLRYLYQFNNYFALGGGLGITIDNREGNAWDENAGGYVYYDGGTYIMPTFSFVIGNKVDSVAFGGDVLIVTADYWEGIHGTLGLYFKNFFMKFSPIYFTTQGDAYEYAHESYWELGYSIYFGE